MRKLPLIALTGAVSAVLGGTAVAARPQTHVMDVSLPDGSVAQIEYVGDVAPKVTFAPPADDDSAAPLGSPDFAGFERVIAAIERRSQELAQQAQESDDATPYIASFGNQPAGVTSSSVVSVSNGAGTCTRMTEVVSQGPGKPPKVSSTVSGNCGAQPAAPATASPSTLDRT